MFANGGKSGSRKVMVGSAVAAGVMFVEVTTGAIGMLWPVVAACGWIGGALLTPAGVARAAVSGVAHPAPVAPPAPVDKRTSLHNDLLEARSEFADAPDPIIVAFEKFYTVASWLLKHWDRLAVNPLTQSAVETIIHEHLLGLLVTYGQVLDREAEPVVNKVVHSLGLLQGELEKIRGALAQDSLRELDKKAIELGLNYGDVGPTEGFGNSS